MRLSFTYLNSATASLQTEEEHLQSALQIQLPCISQSHEYSGSPLSASQPQA